MMEEYRKRRIRIVCLWLAFIVLTGVLFSIAEQRIYYERARKDLFTQADAAAGQISSILDSDYYAQRVLAHMPLAKARTLEKALEPYESIEEAKALLDDFSRAPGG